jgi:SAM-dependent methyltransferase
MTFAPDAFDHIFASFVLEHLSRPRDALAHLSQVLKPGGTLTVIEGDHGSAYFHPESTYARRAIQCLIELQARAGGDSLIGRTLYPLLLASGFGHVTVSPRMVYVDSSRPRLVDGFTKKTFTAMVEGVRERALAAGLIDEETWEKGIRDLYRTAEADGTFCYAFFKAVATR